MTTRWWKSIEKSPSMAQLFQVSGLPSTRDLMHFLVDLDDGNHIVTMIELGVTHGFHAKMFPSV